MMKIFDLLNNAINRRKFIYTVALLIIYYGAIVFFFLKSNNYWRKGK